MGPIRRILLRHVIEHTKLRDELIEYIIEHSPMIRNYIRKISEVTKIPEEEVARSEPVINFARKVLGL